MDKKTNMNRRSFVKASSLAVGGVMMSSTLAAKAHIDGDDAIKIGLIGCGGRGTGAIVQALSSGQNVKLVAMADAFRDRLDKCYQQISEKEYTDWSSGEPLDVKGMLEVPEEHKFVGFDGYKKVLPLVDVVILTTPPGFRPIHFEAAVEAGKHIFTEKPMAVDAPGVRRVLAAAEKAKAKKLNVVVGLQRRYQKIYTEWVERMREGVIGDIVTSHVYWNSAGVWVRPREAGQTEMEYQMRNWYYFNWLCGDHINEQHIHNIDVANWVKDAFPVKAYGMGGRRMRTGKDHGEIFDHHFIEFEYEDGSRMFSQCRHWKGVANRVTESFQGTNGSAPKPGVLLTKSGYPIMKYNAKKDPNPYQVEHNVLFKAIADGEYKFADAEHGAKSTMTAILGRMATYSGQIVTWDDAIASNIDLSPTAYSWSGKPQIMPDANGNYPIAIPGQTKVV
ncbi:MAG: Gfo/Idh/MocA family oxidoreductase [Saprospiraceae bacterium]